MRTNESVFLAGSKQGLSAPNTATERVLVTPTYNNQLIFSGADGGDNVDEQFYGATNTDELFRVGRSTTGLAEIRQRWRKVEYQDS